MVSLYIQIYILNDLFSHRRTVECCPTANQGAATQYIKIKRRTPGHGDDMQLTAWELFKESGYMDTQTCHELFCESLILHWIPEKAEDLKKNACFLFRIPQVVYLICFLFTSKSAFTDSLTDPPDSQNPSHVDDIPAVFLHTCPKEGIHRRRDPEFRLGWYFRGWFHQVLIWYFYSSHLW